MNDATDAHDVFDEPDVETEEEMACTGAEEWLDDEEDDPDGEGEDFLDGRIFDPDFYDD